MYSKSLTVGLGASDTCPDCLYRSKINKERLVAAEYNVSCILPQFSDWHSIVIVFLKFSAVLLRSRYSSTL